MIGLIIKVLLMIIKVLLKCLQECERENKDTTKRKQRSAIDY